MVLHNDPLHYSKIHSDSHRFGDFNYQNADVCIQLLVLQKVGSNILQEFIPYLWKLLQRLPIDKRVPQKRLCAYWCHARGIIRKKCDPSRYCHLYDPLTGSYCT